MGLYDAFRAINSSNSGFINCSELYGALEFLGLQFEPSQVYELMKKISTANEGKLKYHNNDNYLLLLLLLLIQ